MSCFEGGKKPNNLTKPEVATRIKFPEFTRLLLTIYISAVYVIIDLRIIKITVYNT